ncbi:MAG: glycosyltransferase family 4 protein [Candidatus Peribacteraceae bacterium]|nr:glycosyltransferase family 4 protein [Candidatus Peribacteraceae bacterium]
MQICALGYDFLGGARYWVIQTGLRRHGFDVIECNTQKRGFLAKYRDLCREYWKLRKQVGVIFVPFPGHYIMPLAWVLGRITGKPIVFDVFVSLYDTNVEDRKSVPAGSLHAHTLSFMDWLSCTLASIVLIDTGLQKQYFVERYGIREEKILVLPVGCRTDIFQPQPQREHGTDTCTVLFHGTFIPLQGIEVILRAAAEMQRKDPTVKFHIIGGGQTYEEIRRLAEVLHLGNVVFAPYQPMKELAQAIANADMCLGIFGTSEKAQRVIPHKVYDILCMGKPLITGDTPATRSALRHGTNAILTKPGDASALAEAILALKGNAEMRQKIAENGRELFREKFLPQTIVAPLAAWLDAQRSTKK